VGIVYGAIFAAFGGYVLGTHESFEDDWRKGLHLDGDVSPEKKLQEMESLLQARADREFADRMVAAAFSGVGLGVGGTLVYALSDKAASNQSYLIWSAVGFGLGIVTLLHRTYSEQLVDEYHSWSAQDESAAKKKLQSAAIRLSPFFKDGGAGGLLALEW
jgi:hypothetical protein